MLFKRKIDHIVYAVPNLEEAIGDLEKRLGIQPTFGGYHTTKGTKNALVNLGNECYLEILAIDEKNTNIKAPRWMGVDLAGPPQITRWSLKSSQLVQDSQIIQGYHPEMGVIEGGQRKMTDGRLLTWNMILPLAAPRVELMPFMTDWQRSDIHPARELPKTCKLEGLQFYHPSPESISGYFDQLGLEVNILKSEQVEIKIGITCPKGRIQL